MNHDISYLHIIFVSYLHGTYKLAQLFNDAKVNTAFVKGMSSEKTFESIWCFVEV